MLDLSEVQVGPKIVTCTIENIVEVDDLHMLLAQGEGGGVVAAPQLVPDDPTDMSRVRERWHGVARLTAQGLTQRMVASICGYTEAYLSVLLNNPAMQEMVDLYRLKHQAAAEVIGEKLRTVGGMALEALGDKLAAGQINDVHELTAVAKLGLDRSGHGPSSTQHVVGETHIIDHAELTKLHNNARASSREAIISLESRRALPAPEDKAP